MLRAACHCAAVRLEVARPPDWVIDCNCSLCRRYGALWAHYRPVEVMFVAGEDHTDAYVWGESSFAFHRCRTCGCLTHHTALDAAPPRLRAVNVRMMPALDPASVKLQHTDNAHTGFFWTRSPDKLQHGEQAAADPDGWR